MSQQLAMVGEVKASQGANPDEAIVVFLATWHHWALGCVKRGLDGSQERRIVGHQCRHGIGFKGLDVKAATQYMPLFP
ncbi:hypothetical protein D3C86_1989110 [compost metagenome]